MSLNYLLIVVFTFTQIITAQEAQEKKPCTFSQDGSQAVYPDDMCDFAKFIRANAKMNGTLSPQQRYRSYVGPTGTGKSFLARLIAKESQSTVIPINTPILQDNMNAIDTYIEQARKTYEETQRPVLFIFEEADAVAHEGHGREQQEKTAYLHKRLNMQATIPIFAIFTSNRFLNNPLASLMGQAFSFPNPHADARHTILQFFAKKYKAPLEQQQLQQLAANTEHFNWRSLEHVVKSAAKRQLITGAFNFDDAYSHVQEMHKQDASVALAKQQQEALDAELQRRWEQERQLLRARGMVQNTVGGVTSLISFGVKCGFIKPAEILKYILDLLKR